MKKVIKSADLRNSKKGIFVNLEKNTALLATRGSFGYKYEIYESVLAELREDNIEMPSKRNQAKNRRNPSSYSIAQMKEVGFELMTEKEVKSTGLDLTFYGQYFV